MCPQPGHWGHWLLETATTAVDPSPKLPFPSLYDFWSTVIQNIKICLDSFEIEQLCSHNLYGQILLQLFNFIISFYLLLYWVYKHTSLVHEAGSVAPDKLQLLPFIASGHSKFPMQIYEERLWLTGLGEWPVEENLGSQGSRRMVLQDSMFQAERCRYGEQKSTGVSHQDYVWVFFRPSFLTYKMEISMCIGEHYDS